MSKSLTIEEIHEAIHDVVKAAFLLEYQKSTDAENLLISVFTAQADRIANLEARNEELRERIATLEKTRDSC